MDELEQLRAQIDGIDAELAALFERRMASVAEIAAYKQAHALPVRDPAREADVLATNEARLQDPSLAPCYRQWQQQTLALSRMRQRSLCTLPPLPDAAQRLLPLGENGCLITVARGLLAEAGRCFRLDRRVLVVTDDGVPAEYARALAAQCAVPTLVTIPQGEASKSLAQYERLLQTLLEHGFTRADCVVAVGGGMVCDLAGFAAATYQRGIDFYSVPTTLLAQLDAAVGGKNGCDLGGVKNQVGTIRQPLAVLIDSDLLNALPPRQLANGLAEAVKAGLIADPALFALLEAGATDAALPEIIERALAVKSRLVLQDETEQGARRLLNFGHTLGHGYEAVTGLLHGECVALGMLPMCSPELRPRVEALLRRLGLPTRVEADPEAVLAAALHDKKRDGDRIHIVTAQDVGCCRIEPATIDQLRARLSP